MLDEDGMTRPVWNQRSLSWKTDDPFNLLPGITLTNAFLVSNQVLDRLSVRCWLFDMQGILIWWNASAKRDPMALSTLTALAETKRNHGNTAAVLDDGSVVRWATIRDLQGTVIGWLALSDRVEPKRDGSPLIQTGVAVCQKGTFVMATAAARTLMRQDLVGMAWDDLPGLPPWKNVVAGPVEQWLVDPRTGQHWHLLRAGVTVMIEFTPWPLADERPPVWSTTAEMVHEIRNPLTALRGFIELALKAPEASDYPEFLQRALVQVERLDAITAEVLLGSKPWMPKLCAITLVEAIAAAWAMIDPGLREHIVLDVDENVGTVEADPDWFHQILINILKNAVEAMKGQGRIRIGSDPRQDLTVVRVQDDGPGMSDQVMTRIFERSQTTKAGGSGLGLVIVQRLMREHSGQVRVTSSPSGTLVELVFPTTGSATMPTSSPQTPRMP